MSITSVISLLGGLAFFLFGMSLMGDALSKIAGGRLETTLGELTSNPLKGVVLGTLVTAVIQSSSATSIMVVGFVNSGIMTLAQGLPIIMGANIGTTATGWLLSLSSIQGSDAAALFSTTTIFATISVIGVLFYMLAKTSQRKNIGVILLSLGVLLNGMRMMSTAVDPLKENEAFLRVMTIVSNPFLCILIGIIVTAIVQSCSASIGILQALAVTGVVQYQAAVYLVVGMSIGACVPVLVSSIGASTNGRRAALSYLYFDAVGGAVFLLIFSTVTAATGGLSFLQGSASSIGIAIINTVFKIFAVIVLFPFRSLLIRLVSRTVPERARDMEADDAAFEQNLLDERFLTYPAVALEQSSKTINLMAMAACKNLTRSAELLLEYDQGKFDRLQKREDRVDRYEDQLSSYLVKLSAENLTEAETALSGKLLQSVPNFERISDHAVDISELARERYEKKLSFSREARAGLDICIVAIKEIVSLSFEAFKNDDIGLAEKVEPLEDTIDILTERLKEQHVARLQAGLCTLDLGFIFNGCMDNFERVADHCSNIALIVLEAQKDIEIAPHSYTASLKAGKSEKYQAYFQSYGNKYLAHLEDTEKALENAMVL